MSFTSLKFILFILIVVSLYYGLPRKCRRGLILCANLFFYAVCGVRGLVYILFTSVFAWKSALVIEGIKKNTDDWVKQNKETASKEERKAYKAAQTAKARKVCMAFIILSVFILAFLKQAGSLFTVRPAFLILPMGISFYTLQAISYVVDVHWGKHEAEKSYLNFLMFISFFPQLVQGPITRYQLAKESFFAEKDADIQEIQQGMLRILWGFFKKMVIADRLAIPIRAITGSPESYGGAFVILLILLYAFQLYADFSGGIDITIGIGRMLGFTLAENFNRPYFSKTTAEYWRRWHMSMGSWFRDYVFYPLFTSASMRSLGKTVKNRFGTGASNRICLYLSTIILWTTTGLWHGTGLNFIAWGLCNGIIILVSQELTPFYNKFHGKFPGAEANTCYRAFQCLRTFTLMSVVNVLDLYPDIKLAGSQIFGMFSGAGLAEVLATAKNGLGIVPLDWIAAGIGLLLMFAFSLRERRENVYEAIAAKGSTAVIATAVILAFAVIIFGIYGIGYDASQFIYNQF